MQTSTDPAFVPVCLGPTCPEPLSIQQRSVAATATVPQVKHHKQRIGPPTPSKVHAVSIALAGQSSRVVASRDSNSTAQQQQQQHVHSL